MALEASIEDWSLEHDRAVRDLIITSAATYRYNHKEKFPPGTMVVGDNWWYLAMLEYLDGEKDAQLGKIVLKMSEAFNITPIIAQSLCRYIPLEEILEHFQSHLGEEIALFPVSERRRKEAKNLGIIRQPQDDWYEIQYGQQKIKVFPLVPDQKATYSGNTGFIPLNQNPPF